MPEHKNQHYVPRCYLRSFSLDKGGTAINLILLSDGKAVSNAPVKNQCSKNYFYGRDLFLEKSLGALEADYSNALFQIENGQFIASQLEEVKRFAFFQHMRADAIIRRYRMATSGLGSLVFTEGHANATDRRSDFELIRDTLNAFFKFFNIMDDLAIVVAKNMTSKELISSDDPPCFANRFYSVKLKRNDFGFAAAGLILVLPLSPTFCFIAYDKNVYRIEGRNGFVVNLMKESDLDAINSLQMIKFFSRDIYYKSTNDLESLRLQVRQNASDRQDLIVFHCMVPDSSDASGKKLRRLREGEQKEDFRQAMVLVNTHFPTPPSWISFVKFRSKTKSYYNGTGVGHVRKEEWLTSAGLAKEAFD